MAIAINAVSDVIKVISRLDDCVNCDEEQYEKYLETLEESILQMDEGAQPVRFVLKSQLDYKSQRRIKQDQVSVQDGAVGVNLGFMMLELRLVLKDIENPGSPLLTFVKGKDGLASEELIARLESLGISSDLITARNHAIKPKVSKKS
jgi:hypothetical protein